MVALRAHALKSSSANVGAVALSALCHELERMGREQRLDEAAGCFRRLNASYLSVCRNLEQEKTRARAA